MVPFNSTCLKRQVKALFPMSLSVSTHAGYLSTDTYSCLFLDKQHIGGQAFSTSKYCECYMLIVLDFQAMTIPQSFSNQAGLLCLLQSDSLTTIKLYHLRVRVALTRVYHMPVIGINTYAKLFHVHANFMAQLPRHLLGSRDHNWHAMSESCELSNDLGTTGLMPMPLQL